MDVEDNSNRSDSRGKKRPLDTLEDAAGVETEAEQKAAAEAEEGTEAEKSTEASELASGSANDEKVSKTAATTKAATTTTTTTTKSASSGISISASAAAAAAQLSATMGWNGLYSILSVSAVTTTNNSTSHLPTPTQVQQAARKCAAENPPFVHLSKTDSCPQLKFGIASIATTATTATTTADGSGNGAGSAGNSIKNMTVMDNETKDTLDSNSNGNGSGSSIGSNNAMSFPSFRLYVQGGMRGYRMSRATQGIGSNANMNVNTNAPSTTYSTSGSANTTTSAATTGNNNSSSNNGNDGISGNYYFEVLLQPPPKASEIVAQLPANVRLNPKLKEQIDVALANEKSKVDAAVAATTTTTTTSDGNDLESSTNSGSTQVGGHVRVGFSNRTADLAAPVGFDKWSYGIRDIDGSIIHECQRNDHWGGEGFGPGDVLGCAITISKRDSNHYTSNKSNNGNSLNDDDDGDDTLTAEERRKAQNPNLIRFFKNGKPLGRHKSLDDDSKSKKNKEVPIAFEVPDGIYYPAVSLYMGARVQVNFGPHFYCPPITNTHYATAKKNRFKPVSDLHTPPISVEDAVAKATKEKVMRKVDTQKKFLELVAIEAKILEDLYIQYRKSHVQDIYQYRTKQNLPTDDLEADEYFDKTGEEIAKEDDKAENEKLG